jgi:hypothetical protein
LKLRLDAVGVSATLLFLREPFKALGGLKELLAGLIDGDPLGNGPDLLRLMAIFRRLVVTGMMHGLKPPPELIPSRQGPTPARSEVKNS